MLLGASRLPTSYFKGFCAKGMLSEVMVRHTVMLGKQGAKFLSTLQFLAAKSQILAIYCSNITVVLLS